ncbi:MAG: hypothetical protein IPP96_11265 [Chitinophagaceae bacterium]|nr:hypothetical protein [Chitinophagaceae bacterium]
MKLRQEILKEHSKAQCSKIVKWVGSSQERFDQLFGLFLNDEYRVVQRAAWPVSYCVIAHPIFINKHWKQFINNLKKTNLHDAVKRNSVRLMQYIEIPKKHHGEIMDICFKYLESPTEPLAVKVFSMSVLANLAKVYPEIKAELKLIIEDQLPDQTAGFKSRAKKVLKELNPL